MMEQFIKGRMKVFAKDVITTFQGLEDIYCHENTTKKGLNNENSNNISGIKFYKLILSRQTFNNYEDPTRKENGGKIQPQTLPVCLFLSKLNNTPEYFKNDKCLTMTISRTYKL